MSSPLTIVNPSDRNWTHSRFVLSFGAVGTTHLMVYANGLGAALETCAEWLAEHAPGHIMAHDSDELKALYKEACIEHGVPEDDSDALAPDQAVHDTATADLTYTEAGYLTSHEWSITLENPTRAEIKAFIASLADRHYSDSPVVAVAL